LGENVVVGAGAILLGPITLGNHARVGAGSVLLEDVEDNMTVVGVPAHPTTSSQDDLRHNDIVDPIDVRLEKIENRLSKLENV
jgi:serine O-acetyltransferase